MNAPILSELPSFGSVFAKAGRAAVQNSGAVVVHDEHTIGTLAWCGTGDDCLAFSHSAVSFVDKEDKAAEFTWEQLDFILPYDLSLCSDKLHTFSDMDTPASRLSGTVGKVFA